MALFACAHCEDYRAQRDRAQQELSAALLREAEMVTHLVQVKRHDLGMPLSGQMTTNPVDALGHLTKGAIEEMGAGYADLTAKLTNFAVAYTNELRARNPESDVDEDVAERIRQGDEA